MAGLFFWLHHRLMPATILARIMQRFDGYTGRGGSIA
jgi:hypothetical protein